jgi:hypothetical protein
MKRHYVFGTIGALALAASVTLAAQQAPAGQAPAGGQGRAGGGAAPQQQQDNTRVLIAGENPAITHRGKPGGGPIGDNPENPAITAAQFWRVSWSPAGPGANCFITVNQPTRNAQKFVITDNPALAEYIAKEIMPRLIRDFNDPPYVIERGTVAQTIEGPSAKTETCKSAAHNVELRWRGLGEPRWAAPGYGVNMSLVIVPNTSAEILLEGKRAPGEYSSGFIAANETWRIDR